MMVNGDGNSDDDRDEKQVDGKEYKPGIYENDRGENQPYDKDYKAVNQRMSEKTGMKVMTNMRMTVMRIRWMIVKTVMTGRQF